MVRFTFSSGATSFDHLSQRIIAALGLAWWCCVLSGWSRLEAAPWSTFNAGSRAAAMNLCRTNHHSLLRTVEVRKAQRARP